MGDLLKVLGMTASEAAASIHRVGEKVGGLPVDNRWTTVDNPVHEGRLWTTSRVLPLVLHSKTTGG
ncbi:hypothetical protein C1I95_04295 [Micromonospora craterilacus]|uniref:Uncharacterized protein n=1 Tax=Micromonospora craterilacus TaxID=1655439 RepID=A0A2W2F0X8_9ACTN|nr:hypothetical protein C1I95_04295 [Micromonospora craterilacus]